MGDAHPIPNDDAPTITPQEHLDVMERHGEAFREQVEGPAANELCDALVAIEHAREELADEEVSA